jgi:lactate permease
VVYSQDYNPLGNAFLSTIAAALPVLALFMMLVVWRKPAPLAAAAGALVAFALAVALYRMPVGMATMSFLYGLCFGLIPVAWVVTNAMFLYNLTVVTGKFEAVRRSVAGLSADHRIQAVIIGFSFGAFLEGSAGGGTPVAICGALLVGLGFKPFLAAALCLLANTSPVAFGGLGTPIVTLAGVTGLDEVKLAATAGRQLPILSCIVPIWMVRSMVKWKETIEVLPILLVAGGSFAGSQYFFAHQPGLWKLTDIASAVISLVCSALFLKVWRPRNCWRFEPEKETAAHPPLARGEVFQGWLPFGILFVLFLALGLDRDKRLENSALGPIHATYVIKVPGLHDRVARGEQVLTKEQQALPLDRREREKAEFKFNWLTTPGTIVLATSFLSILALRISRVQVWTALRTTIRQMRIPVPTIATMMGLGFITRYGGLDATLGLAFTRTGVLYPFFAALLGWLGVFLTGTDASSNALFGSLQKLTAVNLGLNPILTATANSTGGVMGKMIDAQSICVATAATDQIGKEADIFKFVLLHSFILAAIVGGIVLVQAYLLKGTVPAWP